MFWIFFSGVQFYALFDYHSIIPIFSAILALILGISFLNIEHFTYLTLANDALIVHARRVPWKKRINYSDIKKGEVLGIHVLLELKNNRMFKLRNDFISNESFTKFKQEMEKHSIVVR